MITLDSSYTLATRKKQYTEGPILFKRKGIYYFLYTIMAGERYEYYYMMSHTSPLGPYITPKKDLVSSTDYFEGVYGPGHGSVFNIGDDYYFVFLEFGRASTNRQSYVNRLDPHRVRTEYFSPEFAIDKSNGSRWMASNDDKEPYMIADLGEPQYIKKSEIAFVRPTQGHCYLLEGSLNGTDWYICGGNNENLCKSPNTDTVDRIYRYLKVRITDGVPGIWEWNLYKQ